MTFDTTFDTIYKKDNPSLLAQLKEANKYLPWINEAAREYSLQPCIIAGLGSRESAWGLDLKPAGPEGTGDFAPRHCAGRFTSFRSDLRPPDGLGYGRGLMQIDYDYHKFARIGNWKDPRENILYGCSILADNLNICKRRLKSIAGEPVFSWCTSDKDVLRVALAGYNAGADRVISWVISCISKQGDQGDIDELTSGKNYSSDVLSRAGWFQEQGWTSEVLMADILKVGNHLLIRQ